MGFKVSFPARLGLFLTALQIADAVLTHIGVNQFGLIAEGNPVVKYAIHHLGATSGLALVKILAIAFVWILVKNRATNILIFLSGLYTSVVLLWLLGLYQNL